MKPLALPSVAAVALPLALVGFGCAAPVGPEPDAGSAQKHALVEVRAQHAPADGSLVRIDAAARFVSVRDPGLPADALELLGLAWPSVPSGSCAAIETPASGKSTSFRVDLRDVSPVALELKADDGTQATLPLAPRAFPDVVGLVSGVVFVAPNDGPQVSSVRTVSVQFGGGALSGLELPEVPGPLRLLGATPIDGAFAVDARGLELVTSAPRGDDRIVVDVVRGGVVRARCGVDAGGRLRVDAASLGGAGEVTLLVRAQRRVLREDGTGTLEARLERDVEVKLLAK